MKKNIIIISILLTLSMILMITPLSASSNTVLENNTNENVSQFLECDYVTREVTNYTPLVTNNVETTWELFSDNDIALMEASYNTHATNTTNDPIIMPQDIIGNNDMFDAPPISAPYSSVAYLSATFDSNGDGSADYIMSTTGFLVSKNVLVTSAQGVVPRDTTTTTLVELRIYFGLDSDTLSGTSYIHPRRWTWSTAWHDSSNSWKYDYCVVELWDDVMQPYYFNCVESSNTSPQQNVYISGYPSDEQYHQKACHGQIISSNYYNCNFNNDMLSGMHGAPIYNSSYIGIATYRSSTFNMGNLFAEHIFNLICSKISENQ